MMHAEMLTVFYNYGSTGRQRVPSVPVTTEADRRVMTDVTLGVKATSSGTRVSTLVVDTSSVPRTVRVEHTLGPTSHIGVSEVARGAGTRPHSVTVLAYRIGPTWSRVAGVSRGL